MKKLLFGSAIITLITVSFCNSTTSTNEGSGKIAFYSERDGNAEIYIINADGTNLQRLTNNNAQDEYPA
ncbi:MAG: hypothetical protein WBH40_18420 [Ignavibacteriaceae bacterium]